MNFGVQGDLPRTGAAQSSKLTSPDLLVSCKYPADLTFLTDRLVPEFRVTRPAEFR
jgi:hypothetical protein